MTPVASSLVRARRRPAAVLFTSFSELAWALVVATPVHAWARHAWASHPDGDGVLFAGGGRDLMMWLGQEDGAMPITFRTAMVLLVVGALVMQMPLGALVASLAFARDDAATPIDANDANDAKKNRALRTSTTLRIGIGALLPLSGLLALGSLAAIIVVGLGALAGSAVDHALVESMGDARAFHARVVVLLFFFAIAALVGVIVDLARAAIGREAGLSVQSGRATSAWSMMLRGLKDAFVTTRRSIGRATFAWAWRAAAGVVLLAIGWVAAGALGGRGGLALFALFVVHQAVVLARVALRASWLARAVAFVAPVQDQREAPPVAATSDR